MEATLNSVSEPRPLTRDALLAPFWDALTPRESWLVGTEAEKFGVFSDTYAPIPYEGDRGVLEVLRRLVASHGWQEKREFEGGDVIALTRAGASVTLEPGAQLELSGAPFKTVHETGAEFEQHMAELSVISRDLGITWLGVGFHPLASQDDLPWVPKLRYQIMRDYLPTRGEGGRDMMRRTCTVQANYDYADEADAVAKLRVSLALSPIVTAMFANSPFREGVLTPRASERAHTWNTMDPDRSGLLPFVFEDGMSFERYVDWALDVPMFLVKRGSRILKNTGQTFREFMRDGYDGATANAEDWVAHLATLFPEVRLKNTLEVRGIDSLPGELVTAIPALWKGLLYDPGAFARAETLASRLPIDVLLSARADIASTGLRASIDGRLVQELALEVLAIAETGLASLRDLDAEGADETQYLAPIRALTEAGRSPADALRDRVGTDPTAAEIVAATRLA